MEKSARQQLSRGYAPAVLQRLDLLPTKDQLPIAAWLVQTPIGTNYALQILSNLTDLSRKEEQSASGCLTQALVQLGDVKDLPKELGRRVRDLLVKKLKPESSAHQEAFEAWVHELNLPRGVSLKAPKNFEGRQFRLELLFENPEELAIKMRGVVESLQNAPWKQIENF